MKKLMTFCFIILFSVLSALSCFNFAFDALDRIERDKITIVIEKPSNISATDFLGEIDRVILCQEKVQIKNDFFPSCQHT